MQLIAMLLVTNEKKLSAVTDAMTASSTVPAKIPGIPTVQLSGSTLQPAAMVFRNLTQPWITEAESSLVAAAERGAHRRQYPALERRPAVGLNPTTPHSAAGIRTEPAAQARMAASFSVAAR